MENGSREGLIIAGFGGQGIILVCKLVAQAAMNVGREVTFMPSYGAEVRGGTANGMIIIDTEPIASPVVTRPDSLMALNKASLHKFAERIKPGGLLIMNKSLIDDEPEIDDSIDVVRIPADDIATELGNPKATNMVMLGAYLAKKGVFSIDDAAEALPAVMAERYHVTIPVNIKAMQSGAKFVG